MAKNRIAELRREAGMNQRELGRELGVGQTTISAWETGRNEPDYASLHKMAQLFHASIDYLTGYAPDNGRKGLTAKEMNDVVRAMREDEALRKQMEQEEMPDPDEENAEAEKAEEMQRWQESGRGNFYESFKIEELFEYLSKEQRQRVLDVVNTMFPNAANGLYTEEIPHK